MKGVKTERKNDMYFHSFSDYVALLRYLDNKRPSQMTISYHEQSGLLSGAEPVGSYSIRRETDGT